jgi:hypothetical protein
MDEREREREREREVFTTVSHTTCHIILSMFGLGTWWAELKTWLPFSSHSQTDKHIQQIVLSYSTHSRSTF